jgi:uncharacterized integral membrane protein
MRTKAIIILLLAILLIIFALQNTELVHVKLWFWGMDIPLALLIFVCFAIGVITGIIIPTSKGKKKSQPEEKKKSEQGEKKNSEREPDTL